MKDLMSYGNGKLISVGNKYLRHGTPTSGIRVPYYASGYFVPESKGPNYSATTAYMSGSNGYEVAGRFVDFYNIPTFTSTDHWAYEETWFSNGVLGVPDYWTIYVNEGHLANSPMFVDELHYDWRLSVDTNAVNPSYNGYKYARGGGLIFPNESRSFTPGTTLTYSQSFTTGSEPETDYELIEPWISLNMGNTSVYTTPYSVTVGTRANEWHLSGYMRVLSENHVSYSSNMPNPF